MNIADICFVYQTESWAIYGHAIKVHGLGDNGQLFRLRLVKAPFFVIHAIDIEQFARCIGTRLPLRKSVGIGCNNGQWFGVGDAVASKDAHFTQCYIAWIVSVGLKLRRLAFDNDTIAADQANRHDRLGCVAVGANFDCVFLDINGHGDVSIGTRLRQCSDANATI